MKKSSIFTIKMIKLNQINASMFTTGKKKQTFFCIKITKSKKRQNFDFWTEPKITTFLHTSTIHLGCPCIPPPSVEEIYQRMGTFWPTFACGGATCWWIRTKNNNTCRGSWVLHPYQVSLKSIKRFWRRSRKCGKLTPPPSFFQS